MPAAVLPYCGRTMLEGLMRDLQARPSFIAHLWCEGLVLFLSQMVLPSVHPALMQELFQPRMCGSPYICLHVPLQFCLGMRSLCTAAA